MKIVHICLACFYIDGMAYQENLLPKYHAKEHDVYIITSDYSFNQQGKRMKKNEMNYYNEFNIPVKVLEKHKCFGKYSRFKNYKHVYETLCEVEPDLIFCHGGQFVSLKDVIKYCSDHRKVRLFIDQHGDYYNTPVNTIRRRLGQYLIYGYWMRKAVKYTEKFWGVTPWRCEYLNDVYRIPKEKIGYLPMGGDDEKIDFERKEDIYVNIREKYGIQKNDFLLITGGKIDEEKNIDKLMQAVIDINNENIKLLVFGQPTNAMKRKIDLLAQDRHIKYIGWIESDSVYDYFLASDLAVFPGTHSVLWEQACSCGLPAIFKEWPSMRHVDVGGNALFLKSIELDNLKKVILDLYNNESKYNEMKKNAITKGIDVFSYRKIAKKSILEEEYVYEENIFK